MKIRIFFILLLCNLLITANAKNVYTYNLVQTSPQTVIEKQKHYAYPGTPYQYIVNIDNYNGFAIGSFNLQLTNGKFSNGELTKTVSNGDNITVYWDDTPYINAGIKIVSSTVNNPANDSLKAGIKQIMFYKIASLRGQTPVLTFSGNPNQSIGNKQQFTAIVNEMIYPGIMDTTFGFVVTNRKVNYFEWSLPDGWITTNNQSGRFITSSGVRQINVIPNYVNQGTITVRGVNDLYTGFSETSSFFADRGFSFTNFPTSITFGDNTPKTFSTTLFNGITYEWNAPTNWQINGSGNTLEALNQNNVAITPSFCELSDNRVRVRLKMNNEISNWYAPNGYQGIVGPTITANNETFYKYEKATFTLENIITENIQSINCTGEGIYYLGNQGGNINIFFTESGIHTINVAILMNGCSTPKIINKTISVQPHRISISGSAQICNQSTYTINNVIQDATINWIGSKALKITSGQGTRNVVCQKTMYALNGTTLPLRAVITFPSGQTMELTKNIFVGTYPPAILLCPATDIPPFVPHVEFGYTNENYYLFAHGANMSNNAADYLWRLYPVNAYELPIQSTGRYVTYSKSIPGEYKVSVQYNGECGWSEEIFRNIRFEENININLYPNPVNEILTAELTSNQMKSRANLLTSNTNFDSYTIQLWNEYQGHVRTFEIVESKQQLSLQGLPSGMYIALIIKDGKTQQRKIVWKN